MAACASFHSTYVPVPTKVSLFLVPVGMFVSPRKWLKLRLAAVRLAWPLHAASESLYMLSLR